MRVCFFKPWQNPLATRWCINILCLCVCVCHFWSIQSVCKHLTLSRRALKWWLMTYAFDYFFLFLFSPVASIICRIDVYTIYVYIVDNKKKEYPRIDCVDYGSTYYYGIASKQFHKLSLLMCTFVFPNNHQYNVIIY